jgi:hypothetical protein
LATSWTWLKICQKTGSEKALLDGGSALVTTGGSAANMRNKLGSSSLLAAKSTTR